MNGAEPKNSTIGWHTATGKFTVKNFVASKFLARYRCSARSWLPVMKAAAMTLMKPP